MTPGRLRIGIDVGGTFTDFVVLGAGGKVLQWKEESTPGDPLRAIEAGLRAIAAAQGESLERLLSRVDPLVHGTTIATNLLLQASGLAVGLLCTEGFRDVLYFRDGYKPERFDVHLAHPRAARPASLARRCAGADRRRRLGAARAR